MKNKILSFYFGIAFLFLIITFCIGLPIYCRFFYYLHIKPYNLESSGFSYAEIKQAYNEVLNYLTLPFCKFGTGVMSYSESGASHFADCKILFNLNIYVFLFCLVSCIVLAILNKKNVIQFTRPKGYHICFYSAIFALILPIILGALVLVDVDNAFVVFHKIFFPGKENWIFDEYDDEIIKVLPQEFFINCAILIFVALFIIAISIIIYQIVNKRKHSKLK